MPLRRGNYCSPDATTIQGQPDAVTRFVTAFRFILVILSAASLHTKSKYPAWFSVRNPPLVTPIEGTLEVPFMRAFRLVVLRFVFATERQSMKDARVLPS